MVDTANLGITHLTTGQVNKEASINTAFDRLDVSNNDTVDVSVAAGGTIALPDADRLDNILIRCTGAPGSAVTLDVPDGNRALHFESAITTAQTITIDTVSGVSSPVVLQPGQTVAIDVTGATYTAVGAIGDTRGAVAALGKIGLDLGGLREIASNDIDTSANHGGILTSDSTPDYARVNGATDKALRVNWPLGNVDEVQFSPVFMPPDLDEDTDLTIHLLADMSGATDTPTIDVQVFDAVGDTEMGGATAALSSTLAELTVTIANADVSGNPLGFLNIALVPGTHATDALRVYAAWIEYTRKAT
jgi:hypothetical protein